MIELRSVAHRYADQRALDGVDLVVASPRVGLVGVNGAGKSTLLAHVSGSLRPSRGHVVVNGADPYDRRQRSTVLRHVALMPQSLDVMRRMRVDELVAYVGWLRGMSWDAARAAAPRAIASVRLADRAGSTMRTLSGGMLRRVALAQALVAAPDVLLLDEPTTGLDPEQRAVMLELLRELPGNVQIVMSSHVMEDLEDVVDELVVLDAGRVVFHGSVESLRSTAPPGSPRPLQAAFLSVLTTNRAS